MLALRQRYGPGFWGVPGGVVDAGETPAQAAVREAREEVGLAVRLTRLVGLYTLQGGGWPDVLAYVFEGEPESPVSALRLDPGEVAQALWLTPADLAERQPLLPDVEAALQDRAAGRYGAVRAVQRRRHLPPLDLG